MKAKRTKPYTNQEFFTELCARVDLPKILDYSLANSSNIEIRSYECSFWNSLNFGTNEGIYLEIGLEYFAPKHTVIPLGTFKTLETSQEAMRDMARLHADLTYVMYHFMNEHLEDFEWEGYRIRGIKDGMKTSYAVTCKSFQHALELVLKNVDEYDFAQLYDYAKREYWYFRKDASGILFKGKTIEECLRSKKPYIPLSANGTPRELV